MASPRAFRILDADCHQMEPPDLFETRVEARFRERAPRRASEGRRPLVVEGETFTSEAKYPFSTPEFQAALARGLQRFVRAREARFSAASRLADMDAEGVDVQVIYPTVGGQLLGREFADAELLAACCRAYNDWSAEYCSAAPERLRWAAMLPVQDPALAVAEARRAAGEGCTAFYLRPNPIGGRNLFHAANFPLFAEIERQGRPIAIHDSGSPHLASYGDRMDTHVTGHILAHPFEAMSAMAGLIWYGVFERFPRLAVVHVEADAGWVPYWLQRMEQHWDFSGNAEHAYLTRRPTEYFRRNVFVACRGDERTLPAAVELVGDENFVFNTDYPHPDGTWPWGMKSLEEQPIAEASKRRIFWENAARAFRIGT
jgi:predicted TIM-barrel fold metal-dependent hydrolase